LTTELYWKNGASNAQYAKLHLGGSRDEINFMLSVTKTMTGLTLARAVQMGYISMDHSVVSYLNVDRSKIAGGTDQITVEDCMNMRSGIVPSSPMTFFHGPEAILSDTPPVHHGQTFKYQDSDPQLLWHVINAACPGGAMNFVKTNVFGPLGITGFEWKTDDSGVPTGGAGLSFKAKDMLTVGLIMVAGGKLNGVQFVPTSYVETAMSPFTESGDYRMLWHHHTSGFSYSAGGGVNTFAWLQKDNLSW